MQKFIAQCLVASFLLTSIFAQTPTSITNQAETEKAKQERETKALALLEEILTEAQSLKLPENRVYVQVTAADLLWTKDEARARALFQEAAVSLLQMMSGIESDDPNYYNRMQFPSQLRQQMLQVITRRDAQLALDILRATRPPNAPDQDRNTHNQEAQLESQVAIQAAQSDPKRAVQIAEESLEKGFSHGVLDTISQLQAKDPEAARALANKLVTKLKSEDLSKNTQATGLVGSVLFLMNNPANARGEGTNKSSLFSEQDKKDFVELVVAATLKGYDNSAEGGASQLGYTLVQTMPLLEKYAPTQTAALRRKFPVPQHAISAKQKAFEELQQLQQKGTLEQLLAFGKNAPAEIGAQAYNHAAWKAFNQGDTERARTIVNTYLPSNQRRSMLENFDQMLLSRTANEGKLDEARRLLTRIQSPERKLALLLETANTFTGKGDKQTALQLLQEARAMIGNRVENANQFYSHLQLVGSLARLDLTQAMEILEPLVTQMNTLVAAAEVLDGFEQRNGFQNGEMRLHSGGGMLPHLLQQFAEVLAFVASSDFDRSQTVIDRFERSEMRLWMRLSVVQRMLLGEPGSWAVRRSLRGGRVMAAPPLPPPVFRRNED